MAVGVPGRRGRERGRKEGERERGRGVKRGSFWTDHCGAVLVIMQRKVKEHGPFRLGMLALV